MSVEKPGESAKLKEALGIPRKIIEAPQYSSLDDFAKTIGLKRPKTNKEDFQELSEYEHEVEDAFHEKYGD